MRIIGIDTGNGYLARRIELELLREYKTVKIENPSDAHTCDAVIRDIDTGSDFQPDCRLITVSAKDSADIMLPAPTGIFAKILSTEKKGTLLRVDTKNRTATLGERKIRLTEIECSLLTLLVNGNGEFISREQIRDNVWQGKAEDGSINIYVHYLREKLEHGSERIILSSRKSGYAIDKRFLGGNSDADVD